MKALFVLLALVVLVPAQELVHNGDFEDGLSFWTLAYDNSQGSYAVGTCTTYHPDPDYEVRVYKYMRFYARLSQTVDLPHTNVLFSGSARLLASKGATAGYYAYAAIILEYLNAANAVLGRTLILKKVGDYDPQNTPTQHIIPVTGDEWTDYGFALADELGDHLPGINPQDVARVTVSLESYGTGSSG